MKNIYNTGKIYRIVCNDTGLVYIGSTTQKLCRRLCEHKYEYKKKRYSCSSYEIIKGGNYDIILIEECNCNNKEQLHARERYHIENTDCVNVYLPNRSPDEIEKRNQEKCHAYYLANIERLKEYHRSYREAHKKNYTT